MPLTEHHLDLVMEKVDLKRDGYVDLEYVNFMIILNIKAFFIFLIPEASLHVLNFIVLIFHFFFLNF